MRRIIFTAVLVLGFFSVVLGFENEGKRGMSFLKVGVGARASGMGEAFTAVANDAFANYWNPAGLLAAENSNVVVMHNIWIFDISGDFAAFQLRGKRSAIGFHVYSFNIGDIPVRTIPSEEPLENTSANYLSMGVSYARSLSGNIDAGITVKYLFEKIWIHSASGFAGDFGVRMKLPVPNLIAAGVIQNVGKMSVFENEATRLPVIGRVGALYDVPGSFGGFTTNLAVDFVQPVDENLRIHFGSEITAWQQIIIRLGYMNGYDNHSVSFGLGVHKSTFHFDYSLTPFYEDLETGHRFSIYVGL